LNQNWELNLKEAGSLENKFEFFNDYLKNPFKD